MVRSKCGMPPTISTPRSSARSRLLRRGRRAVVAVLREGDELQVDIGRDRLLHVEQRLDREQPVVADIDMGADREQPLADREVAIAERPLHHRLMGEERLELAPERDAFEQRARLVEPRQAERQRRIHVEMAVDEGRRHQPPAASIVRPRLAGDVRLDRGDLAAGAGDVDAGAPVGKGGVLDEEVDGHGWKSPGRKVGDDGRHRARHLCHRRMHAVAAAGEMLEGRRRVRPGHRRFENQDRARPDISGTTGDDLRVVRATSPSITASTCSASKGLSRTGASRNAAGRAHGHGRWRRRRGCPSG